MISQQTARACLKYVTKPINLPPSAEYLGKSHSSDLEISSTVSWKDHRIQLAVLERRARESILRLGKQIQRGKAWKGLNIECVNVSRAHVEVSVLRTFINAINSASDLSLRAPLTRLCDLVCVSSLPLIVVCSPYPNQGDSRASDVRDHYPTTCSMAFRGLWRCHSAIHSE